MRRVVVTGVGMVSPLGCSTFKTWENIVRGGCGISNIPSNYFQNTQWESADLPIKIAGIVKPTLEEDVEFKETTRLSRSILFAEHVSAAALRDAQIDSSSLTEDELYRHGVCIGTAACGFEDFATVTSQIAEGHTRHVSPFFVPRILPNMAAGQVGITHKFRGVNQASVSACATGATCIGDAYRMIQYGDADVMVAGGTDCSVHPLPIIGFWRAKALCAQYTDNPTSASRPFDRDRCGFVIAEGAAVLILEELNHALNRNVDPQHFYGEIIGYGRSSDGYHITSPHPQGVGALYSMKNALKDARLTAADVVYINAHGTATPMGDKVELLACQQLMGEQPREGACLISSTKGATGHMLGAAGSAEAIFSLMTLRSGIVPPTVNCCNVDVAVDPAILRVVGDSETAQLPPGKVVMSNSFGFGGTNASLLFKKFSH